MIRSRVQTSDQQRHGRRRFRRVAIRLFAMFVVVPIALTPIAAGQSQSSILLEVGTDLQAVVAESPPGSTFIVGTGVHRLQAIIPLDGQTFIGESGAVLSGALPLAGWTITEGLTVAGDPIRVAIGQVVVGHTSGRCEGGTPS